MASVHKEAPYGIRNFYASVYKVPVASLYMITVYYMYYKDTICVLYCKRSANKTLTIFIAFSVLSLSRSAQGPTVETFVSTVVSEQ